MKPFNLEEAKAGKPVCTEKGNKVRIICYDAKGLYPIIALEEIDGTEVCIKRTITGKYWSTAEQSSKPGLFMATEKHERWTNVYHRKDDDFITDALFKTEKEAKDQATKDIIATVKIEWEDNNESCSTKPTMTLEKHEGWILLVHKPITMVDGSVTEYGIRLHPQIYSTKEEAISNVAQYDPYTVEIIKVEWEDTMKVKFEHERSHSTSNLNK